MENVKIVGKALSDLKPVNIHMRLAVRIAKKERFPDLAHRSVPSRRSIMATYDQIYS